MDGWLRAFNDRAGEMASVGGKMRPLIRAEAVRFEGTRLEVQVQIQDALPSSSNPGHRGALAWLPTC